MAIYLLLARHSMFRLFLLLLIILIIKPLQILIEKELLLLKLLIVLSMFLGQGISIHIIQIFLNILKVWWIHERLLIRHGLHWIQLTWHLVLHLWLWLLRIVTWSLSLISWLWLYEFIWLHRWIPWSSYLLQLVERIRHLIVQIIR